MRGYILTLLLLVTIAGDARGQADSAAARWPEIGSRVRIWTSERRVTGDLVNIRADTLVIRTAAVLSPQLRDVPVGKVEMIPASAITRVEVSRGRGVQADRVIGGAVLGAAAGLVTATVADAVFEEDGWFGFPLSHGEAAALGAVVGAAIGAAPADRWEEAKPPAPPPFARVSQSRRLRLTPLFR